jgi:hypothetical protein
MVFTTTNGLSDGFLKKNHPEYYDDIFLFVKEENISLSERIYLYQNNLEEKPKCKLCDNKVKFIKFYKGYNKYCSRRCSAIDTHRNDVVKNKRTNHLIEKNMDPNFREYITKKSNQTKSEFSKEKKEDINEKRKQTTLIKWGVDNVSKSSIVLDKMRKNISESIKLSHEKKTILNIEGSGFKIINIHEDSFELDCEVCNTNFEIKRYLFNQRKRFNKTICLNCNPISGKSDFESKVFEFINENYKGKIEPNYRQFKKYEIDIYLPDEKIGFECNGLYWHSEIYRDKKYHVDKLNFFKKNNITIINIWEDDWNYKQDIIKSRILYKLKKIKNKVFARKCQIKIVSQPETKDFLNKNHIQGYSISKVNIGLYNNQELVYIMTFGSLRRNLGKKSLPNQYELIRSCSSININVVGAFSKCIKFFKEKYSPNKIISYCDLSFNNGETYKSNGFEFVKNTSPNYSWFHKDVGIRINRWNYRKDKLVSMGHDKSKTEVDIMYSIGNYRIWDCGSSLYEMNFD